MTWVMEKSVTRVLFDITEARGEHINLSLAALKLECVNKRIKVVPRH